MNKRLQISVRRDKHESNAPRLEAKLYIIAIIQLAFEFGTSAAGLSHEAY
jgi:hypothetical protein